MVASQLVNGWRLLRLTAALCADAVLVLWLPPQWFLWGAIWVTNLLFECSGVGCEGPMMFLYLFALPALSLAILVTYVLMSFLRGRSPGMVLMRVPARKVRRGGLWRWAVAGEDGRPFPA